VDYKCPAFSKHTPELEGFREYLREVAPNSFTTHNRTAGSFVSDDILGFCRTPVELGWRKNIKLDHDFTGRAALEAELKSPKRTIVTLVWDKRDVIDVYASLFEVGPPFEYMEIPRNLQGLMWADRVLIGDHDIGVSASRGYSYFFRKMISLCTIDLAYVAPGTEVTVLWGFPDGPQKRIRATVAPAPFKQDKRRVDVQSLPAHWEAPKD
jgi:vanillate/3-O-methylgallate O-demethylase